MVPTHIKRLLLNLELSNKNLPQNPLSYPFNNSRKGRKAIQIFYCKNYSHYQTLNNCTSTESNEEIKSIIPLHTKILNICAFAYRLVGL